MIDIVAHCAYMWQERKENGMMPSITLNIRLQPKLYAALRARAIAERRPMSALVRIILEDALRDLINRPKKGK